MIHPALVAIGLGVVGLVAGGSFAPAPENWFRPAEARSVDVHITSSTTWHPLSGSWEIHEPSFSTQPSRLLNVRAYFSNAFSLTSQSEHVRFRLNDAASGALLDEHSDSTGRGSIFGSTTSQSVWFRQVEMGAYRLVIAVENDAGDVLSTKTVPLVLAPGGS